MNRSEEGEPGPGRPRIGRRVQARIPPEIDERLEALRRSRPAGTPEAEVLREVLEHGLEAISNGK